MDSPVCWGFSEATRISVKFGSVETSARKEKNLAPSCQTVLALQYTSKRGTDGS